MLKYYLLLILMTLMAAIASLFLKKASSGDGLTQIIKSPNLYTGGILYVMTALINVYVLRFLDYSVVMPLGAVTYIWTMVFSFFFLNEKMTFRKVSGVIVILIGAVLVAL